MECGRVQAVLNSTILQSDQEDHLIALLHTAASKMGGNITIRQSPAYSSQAQGRIERFHRTGMGQIRTLRANYNKTTTEQAPASIQSYHGWYDTQRIYSTDMQHMRMAMPASFADGTKTTEHHSASFEKRRSIYCQQ